MLRVGLTGGIGSGKSTVAAAFESRGVPVIDTDAIAHRLVEPGSLALALIAERLGAEFVTEGGDLDRALLRERVFTDPTARRQLESILHPMVRREVEAELAHLSAPYALVVVPLLVEKGWAALVDRILVVDVPEEVQLARTAARSGLEESQVRAIMATQASRSERLSAADEVISNAAGHRELEEAVERLHRLYLSLTTA